MKFNKDKWEVMPRKKKSNFIKQRRSSQLAITTQEWNLRVIINSSIKMSAQCLTVVKTKTSKNDQLFGKKQERKQKDVVRH